MKLSAAALSSADSRLVTPRRGQRDSRGSASPTSWSSAEGIPVWDIVCCDVYRRTPRPSVEHGDLPRLMVIVPARAGSSETKSTPGRQEHRGRRRRSEPRRCRSPPWPCHARPNVGDHQAQSVRTHLGHGSNRSNLAVIPSGGSHAREHLGIDEGGIRTRSRAGRRSPTTLCPCAASVHAMGRTAGAAPRGSRRAMPGRLCCPSNAAPSPRSRRSPGAEENVEEAGRVDGVGDPVR